MINKISDDIIYATLVNVIDRNDTGSRIDMMCTKRWEIRTQWTRWLVVIYRKAEKSYISFF